MHIRLETTDGKLIIEAEIPPGHNLPDIVTYQCNYFALLRSADWEEHGGGPVYREATVYHLNSVESDVKEPSCISAT